MQLILIAIGMAVLLTVGNYFLTQRSKRFASKFIDFRVEFQDSHDAIDAQFNHQDVVVDGLNWHFVDQGPKDGPAILFMHGFPESWYSWRYILPLIDPGYRLIAIDMKGYGRSDKIDGDFNWHTVGRQTKEFMVNGLNITQFYVVSHDWGTLIASVMVDDFQEHILGFVRMQVDLIIPEYMKSKDGFWNAFKNRPQFMLFQFETVSKFLMENAHRFIPNIYNPRLMDEFKEIDKNYIIYEFSLPNFEKVYNYFLHKNWDFPAAIQSTCKNNYTFNVIQLQAEFDATQPVHNMNNVEIECPNVDLIWIRNASHFSNFDQPEFIAQQINLFLNQQN
jgi:pimeloyl-ACP methyl ester carboxylesterase